MVALNITRSLEPRLDLLGDGGRKYRDLAERL